MALLAFVEQKFTECFIFHPPYEYTPGFCICICLIVFLSNLFF